MLLLFYNAFLISALTLSQKYFATSPMTLRSVACLSSKSSRRASVPYTVIGYQDSHGVYDEVRFEGHEYCALSDMLNGKIILFGRENEFGLFLDGIRRES